MNGHMHSITNLKKRISDALDTDRKKWLVMLVIVLMMLRFVIYPWNVWRESMVDRIEQINRNIRTPEDISAARTALLETKGKLLKQEEALKQKLYPQSQANLRISIQQEIRNSMKKAGVTVTSLRARDNMVSDKLPGITVDLIGTGDFTQLQNLLMYLVGDTKAFAINSFEITASERLFVMTFKVQMSVFSGSLLNDK